MTRERLSIILARWLAADEAVIIARVESARGSAPREAGAVMIVSAREAEGTIGGGRLEWEAIAAARAMLASGESARELSLPLGPAIGQCCGGHVALSLKRAARDDAAALSAAEEKESASRPAVLVFGAGHTGRALARALEALPLRLIWIDDRAAEFARAPDVAAEKIIGAEALRQVGKAPPGAVYIVLTHSHALDSAIAAAVLERGDFAYLGLIGSRTKRAVFESAFREAGISEERINRLVCPIGGSAVRDKRPEVIAALTAAEVITALAAAKAPADLIESDRAL